MMIFIISAVAVLMGFLLILLLINKKYQPETPEKRSYSDKNDQEVDILINMPKHEFKELMKNLLFKLGFEIEEMSMTNSEAIDFSVLDSRPIKGGRFIVQCICSKDIKFVDSTYVINLLDHVKGESALKGILMTPHFFTVEALSAADGTQLELINGERLVNLLKDFDLLDSVCSEKI